MTTDDRASVRLDGDFSLSLWIDVPEHRAGAAGSLAARFDAATRTGFTLTAISSAGGYDGPGDELRLSFGLDAGTAPRWIDCGRPSPTANHVTSLTVFEGRIHTGSTDGATEADYAHVYRHEGGTDWQDLGQVSDRGDHGIGPLVVHGNALYAATSTYDWTRVTYLGLPPCRVFRYEAPGAWADCGQPGDSKRLFAMASYAGDLYVVGDDFGVYVYRGDHRWELAERLPTFAHPMSVHGGRLVVGTWENPPTVLRFDGEAWRDLGNPLSEIRGCTQVHSLNTFGGILHVGSWPLGKVSAHDERQGRWIDLGRLGDSTEVNALTAYNGMLYAGALPRAEVFRYDGPNAWTSLRRFHAPPGWEPVSVEDMERPPDGDLRMREWARVTSLTEHEGMLFGSVTSCTSAYIDAPADVRGSVQAMRAGVVATTALSLSPGPHHVVAIRQGDRASVILDGRVAASASGSLPGSLASDAPLEIGTGPVGPYGGGVRDFQAFDRALTAAEVGRLGARAEAQPAQRADVRS
jgi:hypothetical protein